MQVESEAKMKIAADEAQHGAMLKALTAAPPTDAEGNPVQGATGGDSAALIMGMMQEMRRDMGHAGAGLQHTEKLIRDPQTGEIVGIAPMGASKWPRSTSSTSSSRTWPTRSTISERIRSRSC
jgi:hypothetical protein